MDIGTHICTACGDHFVFAYGVHDEEDSVQRGELVCFNRGVNYQVANGIPRFVPQYGR